VSAEESAAPVMNMVSHTADRTRGFGLTEGTTESVDGLEGRCFRDDDVWVGGGSRRDKVDGGGRGERREEFRAVPGRLPLQIVRCQWRYGPQMDGRLTISHICCEAAGLASVQARKRRPERM
jgi:hypothetical protein